MSTYVLKILEDLAKDLGETVRENKSLRERAIKYLEKKKW